MIEIRPIQSHEVEEAKRIILTVAYELFKGADSLEESIAKYLAQGKLAEMDDIQKNYFDNGGTFLVILDDDRIVGTGAFRHLEEDVCELKRMWLLSEYHSQGLGYHMIQELFSVARNLEYKVMRLETDPVFQQRAVEFYKQLGFYEIPRFGDDPDDIGMELIL
ncbi:MAG TPA: GNAT family N-acetyltransferase [Anaerolineales bacterium]|nr:GNAT family N-acetyltransferase [Anaerolineales bacterium]